MYSETSLDVVEGGTAEYTVKLDSEPRETVLVNVDSGDTNAVTASPASLTFTTTNWNIPQTVTVTGVQDANRAHETVRITHLTNQEVVLPDSMTA